MLRSVIVIFWHFYSEYFKKVRRTLMAHILEMALQIQLKFVKKVPYPQKICANSFVCFYLGNVELQLHVLLTPVKYTLVCHTPWVCWAARHTTVF